MIVLAILLQFKIILSLWDGTYGYKSLVVAKNLKIKTAKLSKTITASLVIYFIQ